MYSFRIFDRGLGYGLVGGHSLDSANTSFEILRPTWHIPIMFFLFSSTFFIGHNASLSGETATPECLKNTNLLLKAKKSVHTLYRFHPLQTVVMATNEPDNKIPTKFYPAMLR